MVDEGDSTQLIVELSSPADRDVAVDVTLNSGTAIGEDLMSRVLHCFTFKSYLSILSFLSHVLAGADYIVQVATVTFPAGQSRRAVAVMTLEDIISEGSEQFTATLSNPVGENFDIGSADLATVTIKDDDGKLSRLLLCALTNTVKS